MSTHIFTTLFRIFVYSTTSSPSQAGSCSIAPTQRLPPRQARRRRVPLQSHPLMRSPPRHWFPGHVTGSPASDVTDDHQAPKCDYRLTSSARFTSKPDRLRTRVAIHYSFSARIVIPISQFGTTQNNMPPSYPAR